MRLASLVAAHLDFLEKVLGIHRRIGCFGKNDSGARRQWREHSGLRGRDLAVHEKAHEDRRKHRHGGENTEGQ